MRAILVAVQYSDLLALTLPWNRHHFDSVTVVTSTADEPNVRPITDANGADVVVTDLFYAGGAHFAKWTALEHGLDVIGRHGLLCIMDADVAWPRALPPFDFLPGYLYTPRRRMADPPPPAIPPESTWGHCSLHRQEREFAGYSQTFWAEDEHLGLPPWHEPFISAGTADSFFQAKWPEPRKVRPPWEVLHLGPAGVNWCGRSSPFLDGTLPPDADARRRALRDMIRRRGQNHGGDRFAHERVRP